MLSLKLIYQSPLSWLLTIFQRGKSEVTRALDDPSLEGDPLRAEYVRGVPKAQLFRGTLLQGYLTSPDVLLGLQDMEVRPDDVFIITYPKSGTTWTEELISLIYAEGNVDRVSHEPLVSRVHHVEVGRPLGQLRFLRHLPSPRLLATHLPRHLLPTKLRQNPPCKIIYVMRNPKDTAVSYFHHHRMSTFLGNGPQSWDKFLQHFMAGHIVYGSWFDHVFSYWEFCKQYPNKVFFLSYEELKLDLHEMVLRLCDFLGRPLTESAVGDVVAHCSFASMRDNKMVNREQIPVSDLFDMSKSKFMRKGIIGDWKNHFTPEQSEAFDKLCAVRLAGTDLPIVFEPEEAARLFIQHGRIIHNHPARVVENPWNFHGQETVPCEDHLPRTLYSSKAPASDPPPSFFQVYMQSDPLTLCALG